MRKCIGAISKIAGLMIGQLKPQASVRITSRPISRGGKVWCASWLIRRTTLAGRPRPLPDAASRTARRAGWKCEASPTCSRGLSHSRGTRSAVSQCRSPAASSRSGSRLRLKLHRPRAAKPARIRASVAAKAAMSSSSSSAIVDRPRKIAIASPSTPIGVNGTSQATRPASPIHRGPPRSASRRSCENALPVRATYASDATRRRATALPGVVVTTTCMWG